MTLTNVDHPIGLIKSALVLVLIQDIAASSILLRAQDQFRLKVISLRHKKAPRKDVKET